MPCIDSSLPPPPPQVSPRINSSSAARASHATSTSSSNTTQAATTTSSDDGLRIAWQYRKYIQKQQQQSSTTSTSSSSTPSFVRSAQSTGSNAASSTSTHATTAAGAKALEAGVSREWCHRFDNSSKSAGVGEQALAASKLQHRYQWGPDPVGEMAAAALEFAGAFKQQAAGAAGAALAAPLPVRDPGRIGRLVIQSLGGLAWLTTCQQEQRGWADGLLGGPNSSGGGWDEGGPLEDEGVLLRAVARLRLAVQEASCAAVITCPSGEQRLLRMLHPLLEYWFLWCWSSSFWAFYRRSHVGLVHA